MNYLLIRFQQLFSYEIKIYNKDSLATSELFMQNQRLVQRAGTIHSNKKDNPERLSSAEMQKKHKGARLEDKKSFTENARLGKIANAYLNNNYIKKQSETESLIEENRKQKNNKRQAPRAAYLLKIVDLKESSNKDSVNQSPEETQRLKLSQELESRLPTNRVEQNMLKKSKQDEVQYTSIIKHSDTKQTKQSKKQSQQKSKGGKRYSQWQDIRHQLRGKNVLKVFQKLKQNDQNENAAKKARKKQIQAAKKALSGKVSIIWIFVLFSDIDQKDKDRIIKMYNGIATQQDETKNIVPLCKHAWQIQSFLKIPNAFFKVVTDLYNAQQALKFKINKKIVEFYILNQLGQKGLVKALQFKSLSRKVKGIDRDLQKVITRAQEQIEEQVQLYQFKQGITQRKVFRKFPSFLKLTGSQKTAATLYRSNLYGALKVSEKQKKEYYKAFMELVQERYERGGKQEQNIAQYEKLNHFSNKRHQKQAQEIVKFYVKQSFYYQILNSMLRTMKTTQEFKPCVLPFNETYHSIRFFYQKELLPSRKLQQMTLYRGTRLRLKDFQSLKPGVFIEMFGFMSTSKSLQQAQNFVDQNGYIFVIHVPQMTIPQRFDKYDHGFVDINSHSLSTEYNDQEQILFNALNIYRVREIVKINNKKGQFVMIHIDYGVIFQLVSKNSAQLTTDQRDVLTNYRYCTSLQDSIQDQGDVYLLANQHEQSKKYYQRKIQENQDNASAFLKLANVQQVCGQLDEANKNAQRSLQILEKNIDKNDRQTCMKVFSIHTKNAEISLQKQDYLTADQKIQQALELLAQENDFQRAKRLRQLGDIKFKKGQIKDAEKKLIESQKIFLNLTLQLNEKKWQAKKDYIFSFLALICSQHTKKDIDDNYDLTIKKIQDQHMDIAKINEQINEQLLKLTKSQQDVCQYAQDKQKYQQCVKKARGYLARIQASQTNDPLVKAKLKVVQATVSGYLKLVESQKLLGDAIALVQSQNPYDMKVSEYSTILAQFQKDQLERFSNPKIKMNDQDDSSEAIPYDQKQHDQIYNRCKANFMKAINVLAYNNKAPESPEILTLRNQLGQLELNQSNFQSCQEIILQSKQQTNGQNDHSELAKATLILSKIGFSRGELKGAFESVEESLGILRRALVKKQQPKYLKFFQHNDLFIEIKFHRSRIYQKQLKHDLSLKDLQMIEATLKDKLQDAQSHTLFASLYQQYGAIQIAKQGGQYTFDQFFLKALQIRERQMGRYNLASAVCLCNYAKHLLLTNAIQDAEQQITKAVEVFSRFAKNHPITWLMYLSNAMLRQAKQGNVQATQLYEKALQLAVKKYDQSHITISKIKLKYGKNLLDSGKVNESIKVFQQLDIRLSDQLTKSQGRIAFDQETADQKVSIKKMLYQSLRKSYKTAEEMQLIDIRQSAIAVLSCNSKIDELSKTYRIPMEQFKQ